MQQQSPETVGVLESFAITWYLKPQTAFYPHAQLWKPWNHWGICCWHCLALKCIFMDLYLAAIANANGYAKLSFSFLVAKMAWTFSLSFVWMLLTHTASCLHPPAIPTITSETLHLSLPLFFQLCLSYSFPPMFQFYDVSPLNYIDVSSVTAASITQTFPGLSGR